MLSDNLKYLISKNKIDVRTLSANTGIKVPALYKILSGETTQPNVMAVLNLAKYFNVTAEELVNTAEMSTLYLNKSSSLTSLVPLITWADIPTWENKYMDSTHARIKSSRELDTKAFAIQITSDEFAPKFPEKTILFVDPGLTPKHRNYIILISSQTQSASLKQIIIDNENTYIKSLMIDVPPTTLSQDDIIYGSVVEAKISLI